MAAEITKDGLYPGLSPEQDRERQPWMLETMLLGHPKPDEYKIINFSLCKMDQHCGPKLRVGRVLLATNAVHLRNKAEGDAEFIKGLLSRGITLEFHQLSCSININTPFCELHQFIAP